METTKKETNLDHLAAGRRITDGENIFSLHHIILSDQLGMAHEFSLKMLADEDTYSLFQTPEELEIERLKGIIERQNQEIQRLASTSKPRKSYKKLDPDEVEDIEAQFEAGKLPKEVYETFGISRSSAARYFDTWQRTKKSALNYSGIAR